MPGSALLVTHTSVPWGRTRRSSSFESAQPSYGNSTLTPSETTLWRGNRLEELGDDLVGRHPLGLRVEVEQNAMPQHGVRERADVVEADVIAPVHERARLAPENHPLGRANAGAVVDPL